MKNNTKDNNSNKLKEIIEYGSIFYVLMVFFSFFQVHMYFNYFGIAIYYYTTTFELLFYFIPYFIISHITVLLNKWYLWVIPTLIIYIDVWKNNGKYIQVITEAWNNPRRVFESEYKCKHYNLWKNIYIILSISVIFGGLYICIDLVGTALSGAPFCYYEKSIIEDFISKQKFGYKNFIFQVLFIIWCAVSFVTLYFSLRKVFHKKPSLFYYTLFIAIFFLFVFSSLKTTERIYSVNYQDGADRCEFIYSNDTIPIRTYNYDDSNTGDKKVSVGTTKDYLLIKNFTNNATEIYEYSNITHLKIKTKENKGKNFNPLLVLLVLPLAVSPTTIHSWISFTELCFLLSRE